MSLQHALILPEDDYQELPDDGFVVSTDDVKKWAREYATGMKGFAAFVTRHRPAIMPFEWIINSLPSDMAMLDVGCGTGLLLYLLYRSGRLRSGQGLDVSARTVDVARHAHYKMATRMTFNAVPSPQSWPQEYFDAVSLIDVLHHIPAALQKSFFQAACLRVRQGGLFVYKDMASKPVLYNLGNRLHDLLFAGELIHYVKMETAEIWAREMGLVPIMGDRWNRYVYGHEFRLFRKNEIEQ